MNHERFLNTKSIDFIIKHFIETQGVYVCYTNLVFPVLIIANLIMIDLLTSAGMLGILIDHFL